MAEVFQIHELPDINTGEDITVKEFDAWGKIPNEDKKFFELLETTGDTWLQVGKTIFTVVGCNHDNTFKCVKCFRY